jgi:ABC-type dipeptide/oligopeptide/nickel transport system ATPase component/ABC-type dipeptide/oligopeptide/nickel transport system permease subunit
MTTSTVGPDAADTPTSRQAAGLRQLWTRLRTQPVTLVSTMVLLGIVVVAVLAPLLAPYAPEDTDFANALSGPTGDHLLGTDELGRDVLSQLIFAARTALLVAGGSVLVAMLIGVPLGLVLGYKGGWYDRIGSRGMDIADALPGLMVGFVVIAILGRGMVVLILAIGIIFSMNFARMVRAVTLTERKKLYVDSAHVTGLPTRDILFRQILPNLTGPLAVQGAVFLGNAIKVEAALSFLGLGLPESQPSWGGMLRVAAEHQADRPLMAVPPGIAILVTVLVLNLLGDGLNDALSGRRPLRRRRTRGEESVEMPPANSAGEAVLAVDDLVVVAERPDGSTARLLDGVSLRVRRGEVLGLLGESGSGKSMLAKSILGMLPPNVYADSGSIRLDGQQLRGMRESEFARLRGCKLGVVFQNPQGNLSPVHTVGQQVCEALRANASMTRKQARLRAAELLDLVGVDDAQRRLDQYPHQFSGGMAQRVAIAIALAGEPEVLILDEATSALDVTTQSQVLDLVLELRERFDMAIINITHDLGVAAETCDTVAVLYRGELLEVGEVHAVFDRPTHPYTEALLAAHPTADAELDRLPTIAGELTADGDWIRK